MKNINKSEIHTIFQKIKNGDKQAIEELYKSCKKLIINISFSIVKDHNTAEEISQMTFLKIIQMPNEKLPDNNELTWIYTVTKNQTIDYIRKQHDNIDIDTIYDITEANDTTNEIIDIDTYNNIINCLKEDEKEIVSLKILGDFTFKEIGLILNIPTGTAQWKYYKAVHTLKILLSNLSMFIITTLLYIKTRTSSQEIKQYTNQDKSTTRNDYKSLDSTIAPNSLNGFTAESTASTANSGLFSKGMKIGLLSISVIFLILTIIFGIIFAKRQQKRNSKSSK